MKRFICVLGGKGGTGKSMCSRVLADRLLRENKSPLLIDGDGDVGQLLQFYGARDDSGNFIKQTPENGVLAAPITTDKGRDNFVTMIEYDSDIVLCDMPAGSLANMIKIEEEVGIIELLQEREYAVTMVIVISPYKASIRDVKMMLDFFADSEVSFIVVRNESFGDDEDFELWISSKGRKMLQEMGIEIRMPKIVTGPLAAVDALNLKFSDAILHTKIKLPWRSRIKRWMNGFDDELNKIKTEIGLDDS